MKIFRNLFLLLSVIFLPFNVYAAPITVDFSFDSIAIGQFTYDSALDGSNIGYEDLSSFQLDFYGITTTRYDLGFINSGGFSEYYYQLFNSSTNTFIPDTINNYPTILAAVKNGFTSGFFVNNFGNLITDYAGGGQQSYSNLSITKTAAPVPEPATVFLLGIGLIGLTGARRKMKS